ncbi:hypothetical protein M3484_20945 [Pseudomonas sp. GX19020]|uniref:hypothetical protein n=1 Tax=Pseudomonas sp. GX19020 TaxID=2942277 RepID=UPI0020190A50|nr:hypothetical protein [Pseudomonas sp. GX19020]MCL4069029.1 hypothetical protein [Pseudomonas sp. GX19020]
MADPTLHGNGYACPACEMRREVEDKTQILRPKVPCNVCAGLGRLGYTEAEIVARTVEEARRVYWPEFEKRISEVCHG